MKAINMTDPKTQIAIAGGVASTPIVSSFIEHWSTTASTVAVTCAAIVGVGQVAKLYMEWRKKKDEK
jgi:hypothetical protein